MTYDVMMLGSRVSLLVGTCPDGTWLNGTWLIDWSDGTR